MYKIIYHVISSWYTYDCADSLEEAELIQEKCKNEGWINTKIERII